MNTDVSIVIVTHNSGSVIVKCIEHIAAQSRPADEVIIVDSGSDNPDYLDCLDTVCSCRVHHEANIGFAAANNKALSLISGTPAYILFLNPDTFIEPGCLEKAVSLIERRADVAVVTGMLLGYDPEADAPTGRLDSTGIFRTWYGKWYDRGQGEPEQDIYLQEQYVPAVCGAFMFCRAEALAAELPDLFDAVFFMYKEDIDLSLRLRKNNWKLVYTPDIKSFHCRGWNVDRSEVPREMKLRSARNEMRLTVKHRSPYVIWAVLKYLAVRVFNI